MNCSIKKCNNPAVEELELENGEIKRFCRKNYYHSAKGWIVSLTADEKYKKTEKGKKALRKNLMKVLEDDNKLKEKRESNKRYYDENKDKWKGYNRKYQLSGIGLNSEKLKELKKQLIIERGNECENCKGKERKIILHHKKDIRLAPKLIYDEENCFLLCYSCHKLAHHNKEEFNKFIS